MLVVFTGKPVISYDEKYKSAQRPKAGTTFSITVNVAGTPTPKVTWLLAGEQLSSSNGTNIETKDTYSKLTFKGITGKMSGQLQVKAENKVGSDSADFTLEIKGRIDKFMDSILCFNQNWGFA